MSARDDQMIMLRIMIRDSLARIRRNVNVARLNNKSLFSETMTSWARGQISTLIMLYSSDPTVPRDIADQLYAARVEVDWLLSGKYPEAQPCAWPS